MSKKLTEIRRKIDSIDDRVHDLLMQRANLIVDIAEEKRKKNLQVVHPAREAMMVRRLLGRHDGPLPHAAILSIWRELVGAVCMIQTGLKVVVTEGKNSAAHWDMAKNYFGSVLAMTKTSSPLTAIAAVRHDEASFAVLPWPEDEIETKDSNPWWSYVFHAEQEKMRVVCALPYGSENKDFISVKDKALVISKIAFLPSGEDHSFIGLETDSSVSKARIHDALMKFKMNPLGIYTKSGLKKGEPSLHFIVVNDFIDARDERLAQLCESFSEFKTICKAMGGYPVPPHLKAPEVIVKDV